MSASGQEATLERYLAAITLFALGMRQMLHSGVTSGFALALLMAPLWISDLRRYRGATIVGVVGIAAVLSGIFLGEAAMPQHKVDHAGRLGYLVLLLGTLLGAGVVLWARRVMTPVQLGLCYGAGMLVHSVLFPGGTAGNPWKFVWAVPVAVTVLAIAHSRPRFEIVALLGLAFASIVLDSRSYFATFLITALLALWQLRPLAQRAKGSWMTTVGLMAGLMAGVYYLGTTLLVDGYLGKDAQARTIEQIQTSGSLILGGRPELLATWALMKHRLQGYGAGVVPTANDVLTAKSGMSSINYAPNNGYVEKYMFGGHIELHSLFGDVWAGTGVVGLVLLLVIVGLVLHGLAQRLAHREGDALLIFLAVWTLWNTAFSPLLSAAPTLLLTLGLVPIAARGTPGTESEAATPIAASVTAIGKSVRTQ